MAVHYIIHGANGKFGTMQLINAATSGDLTVYSAGNVGSDRNKTEL